MAASHVWSGSGNRRSKLISKVLRSPGYHAFAAVTLILWSSVLFDARGILQSRVLPGFHRLEVGVPSNNMNEVLRPVAARLAMLPVTDNRLEGFKSAEQLGQDLVQHVRTLAVTSKKLSNSKDEVAKNFEAGIRRVFEASVVRRKVT
uniref:Uncharacterized protein n=1 Tax=Compsopogon caeruleus TaxID=31354 RepID=A0A7S1T5X9_9RHOD|mmetsp:Transcript_11241/g.22609  ORF Transcript_11241/g.22609 Transcript_11241/m.22609 type:complete len:147 (+) Transcript_11241:850-1290(+)|eukprot:CAMPEP_0184684232 /NCGR_PEP_ID=MMETSP0312-20130426/14449_1 /TAXON_ID=31354 /ORGANISM="Compsopogon coeruleus, Strain SAG 36.94" /LENGTH=146 /DNA_ID=CAMNT_0027137217 /DNA_START=841 /DNA_END=1281 /DNA_ORIENTATION=-